MTALTGMLITAAIFVGMGGLFYLIGWIVAQRWPVRAILLVLLPYILVILALGLVNLFFGRP